MNQVNLSEYMLLAVAPPFKAVTKQCIDEMSFSVGVSIDIVIGFIVNELSLSDLSVEDIMKAARISIANYIANDMTKTLNGDSLIITTRDGDDIVTKICNATAREIDIAADLSKMAVEESLFIADMLKNASIKH